MPSCKLLSGDGAPDEPDSEQSSALTFSYAVLSSSSRIPDTLTCKKMQ